MIPGRCGGRGGVATLSGECESDFKPEGYITVNYTEIMERLFYQLDQTMTLAIVLLLLISSRNEIHL